MISLKMARCSVVVLAFAWACANSEFSGGTQDKTLANKAAAKTPSEVVTPSPEPIASGGNIQTDSNQNSQGISSDNGVTTVTAAPRYAWRGICHIGGSGSCDTTSVLSPAVCTPGGANGGCSCAAGFKAWRVWLDGTNTEYACIPSDAQAASPSATSGQADNAWLGICHIGTPPGSCDPAATTGPTICTAAAGATGCSCPTGLTLRRVWIDASNADYVCLRTTAQTVAAGAADHTWLGLCHISTPPGTCDTSTISPAQCAPGGASGGCSCPSGYKMWRLWQDPNNTDNICIRS